MVPLFPNVLDATTLQVAANFLLSPKALPTEQPIHLLAAKVFDQVAVWYLRHSLKIATQETQPKAACLNQVWFFQCSPRTFQKHEKRMIARDVVRAPVFGPVAPSTISVTGGAVVNQLKIGKGASGPPEHVGLEFVHGVPAGSPDQAAEL